MFTLFTLAAAQNITGLNPSLTPECSAAIQSGYPSISVCGNSTTAIADPLAAVSTVATKPALDQLCSAQCSTAFNGFATSLQTPCGSQKLFLGSNETVSQLVAEFKGINSIACVQDSGNYCIIEFLNALVQSGFDTSKPDSITTAILKFSTDKTKACTTCSTKLASAVKDNVNLFTGYELLIQQYLTALTATCAGSTTKGNNGASTSSLAGMVALGMSLVVF
ncbi:hypothetical protein EDD86DRAFT_210268 [Gorgonomyces haynaldii]|nr:hypothetical protein EDD86DRAFT_210268 [Gorgonomyces haynaldii]